MITKLVKKAMDKPNTTIRNPNNGVSIIFEGKELSIFREGIIRMKIDGKIVTFADVRTEAEARAFNKVLDMLGVHARIYRSGNTFILKIRDQFYSASQYDS